MEVKAMTIDSLIPAADIIGAGGFLTAAYLGLLNYRDTHAERVFWLVFVFTSLLGALWLSLVALEWLNVTPELLDALSTSLQAVVIGLFAVGTIGARSLVEDLKASNRRAAKQRMEAIDAREQAEQRKQELERMRDLMRNTERLADVGSWELDTTNDIIEWTDGTREIFEVDAGFSADAHIALRFYHDDDRKKLDRLLDECLASGTSFQETLRIRTAKGSERWVEMFGERTTDSDGTHHIRGCVQDITELQEREEQIAILDRVLRHNIRNDVNKIIGNAQLIKERTEVELTEFIDSIVENANGLVEMANKQRTVTALLKRTRGREEIAIESLINPPVRRLRERYPQADIVITQVDELTFLTIPELEVVIEEIMENAIVHSDRETPSVEIATNTTRSSLQITIADDGPGIPQHERRVINEEIDVDPLKHGSGMGLWMVKRIIHRTGGTLEFEPRHPRGSLVHLQFTI